MREVALFWKHVLGAFSNHPISDIKNLFTKISKNLSLCLKSVLLQQNIISSIFIHISSICKRMTKLYFIDPQIVELFKIKLTDPKTQHFAWKTFHCTKISSLIFIHFLSILERMVIVNLFALKLQRHEVWPKYMSRPSWSTIVQKWDVPGKGRLQMKILYLHTANTGRIFHLGPVHLIFEQL